MIRSVFIPGICSLPLLFSGVTASAADWNLSGGGSWGTAGNWSPSGVPNAIGAVADFSLINITGARQISLDGSSQTIGTLKVGDNTTPSHDTTIYGGRLTMDVASGNADISIVNQNATLRTNFTLNDTTNVNVATFNSTLTLSSIAAGSTASTNIVGNGGMVKNGAGTLVMLGANTFTGGFTLNSGTVRMGTDTALGAATGALTLNGGTLASMDSSTRELNFSSLSLSGNVTLGASGGLGPINLNASNTSLANAPIILNVATGVKILTRRQHV